LDYGFAGPFDLSIHAAARVEDDPQRNWGVFTTEMAYRFLIALIKDAEAVSLEPSYEMVFPIRNRDGDQY